MPAEVKQANHASVWQSRKKLPAPSKSIKPLHVTAKYSDSDSESDEYVFGLGQIYSVY